MSVATNLFPMDLDLTYYLSGPMTGIDHFNFPLFSRSSSELRAAGIKILSPHEITLADGTAAGSKPWQDYVIADMVEMLTKTQGIILLPGWPKSRGAKLELDLNISLGRPVYYYENYALVSMG